MDNGEMKEVLNELFSHLERLETQSEAILQFLKEKKRVTDKQLAPYLEQAGNAANVKWRAARVRLDHLLSPEQPEKEVKLGKRAELHEDSSSTEKRSEPDVKDDKRVKSAEEENKDTRSDDQKQIESSDKGAKKTESANAGTNGPDVNEEKPAPVETVQARPTEDKEVKAEEKAEEKAEKPRDIEQQPTQEQRKQKSESDDFRHPTEDAEPSAEQHGEPAVQLNPDKTEGGKEAA